MILPVSIQPPHSPPPLLCMCARACIVDTFYWLLQKFNILLPPLEPREIRGIIIPWENYPVFLFGEIWNWPTMWWIKLLRLYSRSQKYPFYIISEKISSRSLSNFSNILHTLYFRIISAGNIFLFLTRVTELEYFIFKWGSVDKNGWNSELWKLFWKIDDLEMIYVFS